MYKIDIMVFTLLQKHKTKTLLNMYYYSKTKTCFQMTFYITIQCNGYNKYTLTSNIWSLVIINSSYYSSINLMLLRIVCQEISN